MPMCIFYYFYAIVSPTLSVSRIRNIIEIPLFLAVGLMAAAWITAIVIGFSYPTMVFTVIIDAIGASGMSGLLKPIKHLQAFFLPYYYSEQTFGSSDSLVASISVSKAFQENAKSFGCRFNTIGTFTQLIFACSFILLTWHDFKYIKVLLSADDVLKLPSCLRFSLYFPLVCDPVCFLTHALTIIVPNIVHSRGCFFLWQVPYYISFVMTSCTMASLVVINLRDGIYRRMAALSLMAIGTMLFAAYRFKKIEFISKIFHPYVPLGQTLSSTRNF